MRYRPSLDRLGRYFDTDQYIVDFFLTNIVFIFGTTVFVTVW